MKTEKKIEAIKLRKEGKSVRGISKLLNIPRSTISLWVRSIPLTNEQLEVLKKNYKVGNEMGRNLLIEKRTNERISYQLEGEKLSSDTDYVKGCMLYWAEGSKNKNVSQLGNTDPHLIREWVKFLKKFYPSFIKKIAMYIHYHNGNELEIKSYWLDILNLKESDVRFVKVRPNHDKRVRTGHKKAIHKYGMCTIEICNTRLVQNIYGAIQKSCLFKRDHWLTGLDKK